MVSFFLRGAVLWLLHHLGAVGAVLDTSCCAASSTVFAHINSYLSVNVSVRDVPFVEHLWDTGHLRADLPGVSADNSCVCFYDQVMCFYINTSLYVNETVNVAAVGEHSCDTVGVGSTFEVRNDYGLDKLVVDGGLDLSPLAEGMQRAEYTTTCSNPPSLMMYMIGVEYRNTSAVSLMGDEYVVGRPGDSVHAGYMMGVEYQAVGDATIVRKEFDISVEYVAVGPGSKVHSEYLMSDVYGAAGSGNIAHNEYVISVEYGAVGLGSSLSNEYMTSVEYMSATPGGSDQCLHNEYVTSAKYVDGCSGGTGQNMHIEYVISDKYGDERAGNSTFTEYMVYVEYGPRVSGTSEKDQPLWICLILYTFFLDFAVASGWASLSLTVAKLFKSGAHLCLVGAGATFLTESKWTRGSISKRHKKAPQYDPGLLHAGDCLFACLAYCALQRPPTKAEVIKCRRVCALLWTKAPPTHLAAVAARVGLSSKDYVDQIGQSLWGGLPEIELFCATFCVPLTVLVGAQSYSFGGAGTTCIRFSQKHYTVTSAPEISAWSRTSFLFRGRGGNLWTHFNNAMQRSDQAGCDAPDQQHSDGHEAQDKQHRGGAPRRYPFAQQQADPPQVALIYHGTFAPCHKGHIATIASAHASVELAGARVVKTVIGFTTEKSARRKFCFPELYPASARADIAREVVADSGFEFIEVDPVECSASEVLAARYRTDNIAAVFVLGSDVKAYTSASHTFIVGRGKGEVSVAPFSLLNFRGACNQVSDFGLSSSEVRRSLMDGIIPAHYGTRAASALSDVALGRLLREGQDGGQAGGAGGSSRARNTDALPKPMPKKRRRSDVVSTQRPPIHDVELPEQILPPTANAPASTARSTEATTNRAGTTCAQGARIIVKPENLVGPPDGFLSRPGVLKFAHPRFSHLGSFFRDCVQPICALLGVTPCALARRGRSEPLRVSFVPCEEKDAPVYSAVMDVLSIDELQKAFSQIAGNLLSCMYVAANFENLQLSDMDPDSNSGRKVRALLAEAAEHLHRTCLVGAVPVSLTLFDAHHHVFAVRPFHAHLPISGVAAEVIHVFNSYIAMFPHITALKLVVEHSKCDQYIAPDHGEDTDRNQQQTQDLRGGMRQHTFDNGLATTNGGHMQEEVDQTSLDPSEYEFEHDLVDPDDPEVEREHHLATIQVIPLDSHQQYVQAVRLVCYLATVMFAHTVGYYLEQGDASIHYIMSETTRQIPALAWVTLSTTQERWVVFDALLKLAPIANFDVWYVSLEQFADQPNSWAWPCPPQGFHTRWAYTAPRHVIVFEDDARQMLVLSPRSTPPALLWQDLRGGDHWRTMEERRRAFVVPHELRRFLAFSAVRLNVDDANGQLTRALEVACTLAGQATNLNVLFHAQEQIIDFYVVHSRPQLTLRALCCHGPNNSCDYHRRVVQDGSLRWSPNVLYDNELCRQIQLSLASPCH
eukprot:3420534-Amphidinium_carterae.1